MKVAVFVPRRADGGRRDQVWAFVRARWESEHPTWAIHEGHHDEGPFNRSAAVNSAATAAGDWDVAVITDSDSFAGVDQVDRCVAQVSRTGRIGFAYDRFCYLNRPGSDLVMDGHRGAWEPHVEWTMTGTCSSLVVVRRDLWDRVGGFDEGFIGWGMEDVAFSVCCQVLGGPPVRSPGPVWHLWHEPSHANGNTPTYHANVARLKRYEDCNWQADRVTALLAEIHEELGR